MREGSKCGRDEMWERSKGRNRTTNSLPRLGTKPARRPNQATEGKICRAMAAPKGRAAGDAQPKR